MTTDRDANLYRVKVRLIALGMLQDGWRDGDGLAPTSAAMQAADRLLSLRPQIVDVPCYLFPSPDGGLLFELIVCRQDFDISIPPNGAVEFGGGDTDPAFPNIDAALAYIDGVLAQDAEG